MKEVHLMPGDDLVLELTRKPGVPLGFNNEEWDIQFHGVDRVKLSTIICPDPQAHRGRLTLRERLSIFLGRRV